MPEFVLAFSYKGFDPGRIIDVDESEVKNLVRLGVGKPVGSEVVLRLGSEPELLEPEEAPAEPEVTTKAARRTKKTSNEPEVAEEAAES